MQRSRVGRRIGSAALVAEGQHARADTVVAPLIAVAEVEDVQHSVRHAMANLDRVTVPVHPTVDGAVPEGLHELSGDHASKEARESHRA